MQKAILSLLLISALLGLAACDSSPSADKTLSEAQQETYLEASRDITSELQSSLSQRLMAAMQEDDPAHAIKVCEKVAQPLSREISTRYPNASVSRTSLRTRNPVNRPDEESRSVLTRWNQSREPGDSLPPPDIRLSDGQVIVHTPIPTQALCLKCHGPEETIDDSTKDKLAELYPEDRAVGFLESELRGAFRVVFENAMENQSPGKVSE